MALFSYKAMDPGGRFVFGRMNAINLVDLELRLKRMELDFINGQPVKQGGWFRGAPVGRRELINFCFHLEQLTRAGVPLIEGLTDLRDSTQQPRFREVVAGLIESIEGGRTLSQAMLEHPKVFDQVFCNLVRAGENSGRLPEVLKNLEDKLKREDELASYTKRLFIYPAIVSMFVMVALAVSLVFLVPELAKLFRSTGQALPLQTRILIAASDFFVKYWYLVIGFLIATVAGLNVLIATNPVARYRFDDLKLRLPVLGPIYRKIILSRFAGVFAMLYASGISVIDAVRTTEDVVGNRVIREGLRRVGQLISDGQNVTNAFQNVGLFPPLVVRMLRVGETTGGLDEALKNVGYFYDRDVQESIESAQATMEPALTVMLGLVLLWVALSVLGPVYDIVSKLKT